MAVGRGCTSAREKSASKSAAWKWARRVLVTSITDSCGKNHECDRERDSNHFFVFGRSRIRWISVTEGFPVETIIGFAQESGSNRCRSAQGDTALIGFTTAGVGSATCVPWLASCPVNWDTLTRNTVNGYTGLVVWPVPGMRAWKVAC
jgi:hypothetical protein